MSDWLQVIQQGARHEAQQLKHPYIRSEHLLLALARMQGEQLPLSYDVILAGVKVLPSPTCGAERKLTLARGAQRAIAQLSADDAHPQALLEALQQNSLIVRRLFEYRTQEATDDIAT